MDVSLNEIDLLNLTRPSCYKKFKKKNNNNEKKELYKDKILELTKNLFNNENVHTFIKEAFNGYVDCCIQHLEFMERAKCIQSDYLLLKQDTNKKKFPPLPMNDVNKIIIKQPRVKTMRDFVKINKNVQKIYIPQIRKNINNNYEEEKKKKKENQKI